VLSPLFAGVLSAPAAIRKLAHIDLTLRDQCLGKEGVESHLHTQKSGGRVFSLDASFGLLATVSASVPALFLGSALRCCGVSCMP